MGETILIFGYQLHPLAAVVIIALLCVIIGYALGATFSTKGCAPAWTRKQRLSRQENNVLKGINSLLANNTDQAIKEFSQVVERESESVETYIALGHLFRAKGQFDRAVAVRQSIIARPNLPAAIRIQALYDMGVDYHKSGFLVRAVEAYEQVLAEDPKHRQAVAEMVTVYEELKRWDDALTARRRLDKLTGAAHPEVLAHYKTERGKQLAAEGQFGEAETAFKKALGWDKGAVDALLALGEVYSTQAEYKKALATWRKIATAKPDWFFVAQSRVLSHDWSGKEAELVDDLVVEGARESGDPLALTLAARHLAGRGREQETVAALKRIIEAAPCYLPAHHELGQIHLDQGNIDEILADFRKLIDCLPKGEPRFLCGACGWKSTDPIWKCPSCRRWDTIKPIINA